MTKSKDHGMYSRLLVLFVFVLTEELDLPLENCGDMTCDREDLERGIEPDECFYLKNALKMRGKRKLDFAVDPPPDLAVEIDLTTDARRRMSIHAAIGIPEIWRYDGDAVFIYLMQPDGRYAVADHSRAFPLISAAALTQFIRQRAETDDSGLVRLFRQWVRQQFEQKK
jgi:Uma2 family endonuclease